MAETAADVVARSGLPATFAYTFSDEISVFFPIAPFEGRVEKIDSVVASYAASSFTIRFHHQTPVAFDSRIIPVDPSWAAFYLESRQNEAWRNHMNAWCQYLLFCDGHSPKESANRLLGIKSAELHEIAHAHGVNLAKTPAWQRRGIMVYRVPFEKKGTNQKTGEPVVVMRNKTVIDRDLPLFSSEEGGNLLRHLISGPDDPDRNKNPLDLPVCGEIRDKRSGSL